MVTVATTANTTLPQYKGYGLILDTLYLQVAAGPGREPRITTAPLSEKVSTELTPEDMRQEHGATFSRSDFTGGEGLDQAHRPGASAFDGTRFYASRDVTVDRGEPGQVTKIRLSYQMRAAYTPAAASESEPSLKLQSALNNQWLVFYTPSGSGTFWRSTSTARGLEISPVAWQAGVGTVVDWVVTPGTAGASAPVVYKTDGTKIERSTSGWGTAWSTTVAPSKLWWVKSRIVAQAQGTGGGYALHEPSTGSSTQISTAYNTQWNDVTDAGQFVLAANANGTIYSFADNDSGVLTQAAESTIPSQVPTRLCYSQGVLLVVTAEQGGTGRTLWRATVDTNGNVVGAQKLRHWATATGARVTASGVDYAWVTLTTASYWELWRYDYVTGGIQQIYRWQVGLVPGIDPQAGNHMGDPLWLGGRLYTRSSSNVWAEHTWYSPTGWLIGPAADFYTAAPKSWVGARLDTTGTAASTASLYYSTNPAAMDNPDHGSWTLAVSDTGTGSEQKINATARSLAAKVVLTRGPGSIGSPPTVTPTVRAYAFRGWPLVTDVILEVPINVSDTLERPNRLPTRIPGRGDAVYDAVKAKEGTVVTAQLLRLGDTVRGVLQSMTTPIPAITRRGSPTLYSMLTIRGQRI